MEYTFCGSRQSYFTVSFFNPDEDKMPSYPIYLQMKAYSGKRRINNSMAIEVDMARRLAEQILRECDKADEMKNAIQTSTNDVIKEMAQEGLRKAGYSEKEINSVEVVTPFRKITKK